MKEHLPNIITITETEAKRLFNASVGMTRSDRRKALEGQPLLPPTMPNRVLIQKGDK